MTNRRSNSKLKFAEGRRALRQQDIARQKDDRKAVFMIIGGLSFIALCGAGYFAMRPAPIDETNLCRVDGTMPSHTIVMIDATDKLPRTFANRLRQTLKTEHDILEKGAKFTLLLLNGEKEAPPVTELFSLCNPGRGDSVNWIFGNRKWAEDIWREKFSGPLEAQIKALEGLPEADQTPLIEALLEVSLRSDFTSTETNNRLWVVSDFLHYSEDYSQYSDRRPYESIFESSYMQSLVPNYSSSEITMMYMTRQDTQYAQTKSHKIFWEDYFLSSGAKSVTHIPNWSR